MKGKAKSPSSLTVTAKSAWNYAFMPNMPTNVRLWHRRVCWHPFTKLVEHIFAPFSWQTSMLGRLKQALTNPKFLEFTSACIAAHV